MVDEERAEVGLEDSAVDDLFALVICGPFVRVEVSSRLERDQD